MSKRMPYRRGWLMTWLHLPFDLWAIHRESPADAAEGVRYIENWWQEERLNRPMKVILAALRKRAAEAK